MYVMYLVLDEASPHPSPPLSGEKVVADGSGDRCDLEVDALIVSHVIGCCSGFNSFTDGTNSVPLFF